MSPVATTFTMPPPAVASNSNVLDLVLGLGEFGLHALGLLHHLLHVHGGSTPSFPGVVACLPAVGRACLAGRWPAVGVVCRLSVRAIAAMSAACYPGCPASACRACLLSLSLLRPPRRHRNWWREGLPSRRSAPATDAPARKRPRRIRARRLRRTAAQTRQRPAAARRRMRLRPAAARPATPRLRLAAGIAAAFNLRLRANPCASPDAACALAEAENGVTDVVASTASAGAGA